MISGIPNHTRLTTIRVLSDYIIWKAGIKRKRSFIKELNRISLLSPAAFFTYRLFIRLLKMI